MAISYRDLPVIDLAEPTWWSEPAAVSAPLHEAGAPAAFVPGFDTVMLLRHEDCLAALGDPRLGAMGARYFEVQGWTDGAFVEWIRLNVVMTDPPGHTRLRRLVSRAFTPRAVARTAELSQRVADELCDQVDAADGSVEFVHDWARVMPLRVVCELIGVPTVDVDTMGTWAAGLTVASGAAGPEAKVAGDEAMEAFNAYVREMVARRRQDPGDDLLTALVEAEDEGDRLSEPELVAMVVQLIFAGHETTQNLIGNAVFRLLEHPDQLAALRADPDGVPGAVEEALRYDPPILFTSRLAREDLELAGQPVAADQLVMLSLAGANHDPRRFPDPERFDVTRSDVRHLSFGHGTHFCLGANLARLEATVALTTLLRRYSSAEEVGTSTWSSYTPLRGRQRLDLRLTR